MAESLTVPPSNVHAEADATVHVEADAAASDDMLIRLIDASVRPCLDIVDQLRAVGIEQDIPIPQIAVMGDQSSGKSSVLEAMSGVPFPRGKGLVTTCATELRMKRTPAGSDWQATVKLSESWTDKQPWQAGRLIAREELAGAIQSLTEAILLARGKGTTFESEHSIIVDLRSPGVPDLTLIDLPGIVRTHVQGQASTVIDEVNGLLDKYLRQE
jgi:interferon-induced GTP-binding protein Mx1